MKIRLPAQLHTRATACAATLGISMSELARRGVRASKKRVGVCIKTETTTRGTVATIEIDATPVEVRRGLTLAVETCEAATVSYGRETVSAIEKLRKLCQRRPSVDVGRALAKAREATK